jgi:hypothetical protein
MPLPAVIPGRLQGAATNVKRRQQRVVVCCAYNSLGIAVIMLHHNWLSADVASQPRFVA